MGNIESITESAGGVDGWGTHWSRVMWMRWLSSSIIRSCRLMVLLADYSYLATSNIFDCFCFFSSFTRSVLLAVTNLLLSTLPDFT